MHIVCTVIKAECSCGIRLHEWLTAGVLYKRRIIIIILRRNAYRHNIPTLYYIGTPNDK